MTRNTKDDTAKRRLTAFREWETRYDRQKKLAVKVALDSMRQYGIKYVVCEYSGSSGEGSIEGIFFPTGPVDPEYWTSDGTCTDMDAKAADVDVTTVELSDETQAHLRKLTPHLQPDELEDFFMSLAEYVTPEGYEGNHGGHGMIVFDAVDDKCLCSHGIHYVNTDYTSEEISPEDEDAKIQN